ncbi:MAG TPA: hypothetical protein VNX18_18000 [Bryobacteraceae bacterium]|nr:hypothetical protein [Bryobacteraceae bacterium]
MKHVILGLTLIACLPLFPQDRPAAIPQGFTVFRIRDGFRVSADGGRTVDAIATSIEALNPSHVVRLKGGVAITINGMELRADEVDYHWDTGELEPYGNVHVKPPAQ